MPTCFIVYKLTNINLSSTCRKCFWLVFLKRTRGSKNSVEIISSDDSNVWSEFGNTYPDEIKDFLSISEENCSYQFDSHFFLSLSPNIKLLKLNAY